MKLLLDTHILLWMVRDSDRLPQAARRLIANDENDLLFSVASLREIAIKVALGRPDFSIDPRLLRRALLDNGHTELAITGEHAMALIDLPPIHNDPFDRLLVAQATVEGILLVTADADVGRYPGPIRRV